MERDFLGLNLKDSVVVVKEEAAEGFKDSGFFKGSGVPWPLSSKVSALPPFDIKPQSGEAQNFAGATSKQQFIGGASVAAPRSFLPSSSFVAGTTEPWFTKASGSASQLTIFYGGTVNVFDDITPEKAQAIMFLAGNVYAQPNMAQTRLPVQSPSPKFAPGDAAFVNQTKHHQPSSALSSPISVSSHPVCQSVGVSSNNDEVTAPKTTGIATNLVNKAEPLNMVASLGPVTAANMIPSAVPQARKASLARFLEKRKERAMNSSPYNLNKKSADNANPDSIVAGPSATSITGSSSLSTSNQMP